MAVEIIIKGNTETNEYQDALDLKRVFETQFNSNVNGKILIISNVTLFGQEVKDIDLVVMGSLNNVKLDLKTKTKNDKNSKVRETYINSFCFCIETKRVNPSNILLDGLNLVVKYSGKKSDVTTQSERQKYSLHEFFKTCLNYSPYICNFIWLRNLPKDNLKDLLSTNPHLKSNHNLLPSDLRISWLFQLACIQNIPLDYMDNKANFYSFKRGFINDSSAIEEAFDLFQKQKNAMGDLTRKKMEKISRRLIGDQQYVKEIGKKLIEISGKAGTGKTIKLLSLAFDLAVLQKKRCLILTYNHALVSDIKRTLTYMEIPDGVDTYTVKISTLHKFFYNLIQGFGLSTINFIDNYDGLINELHEYISNGLIEENDIQDLIKKRHEEVAWDFVLIDESQDWTDRERDLLYKIFGYQRILITNGYDQLIRRQTKCNWLMGIEHKTTVGLKSLRQEKNLVSFINSFAKKFNLDWNLQCSDELTGGNVIISTKPFNKELYDTEKKKLVAKNNTAYDMLFLSPPSLVNKIIVNEKEVRNFRLTNEFNEMGIVLWDGTSKEIRTEYPIHLEEHRLLQYESCRGLEGWTVVCLELDEFLKYKFDTFDSTIVEESFKLETDDQRKERFVYLWTLIPLTRAIDTLVITIKNKDSEFSQKLKELYIENKDFVQWIE